MSPILVRPVREQLEHDRIIRLLQTRLKRKHDIAINVGDEQAAPVKVGVGQMYPDLVLTSSDRGKRLEGVVEVETGESVNHLEAMAQWAHFGRLRVPFHLYVPAATVDIARRLVTENQVSVSEIWSYHTIGDQTRFTLVHRDTQRDAGREARAAEREAEPKSEAPRKRPAVRTTTSSRSAASSSRTAARKASPASRAAKARGGRAKPAAKKAARTQKRK